MYPEQHKFAAKVRKKFDICKYFSIFFTKKLNIQEKRACGGGWEAKKAARVGCLEESLAIGRCDLVAEG